MREEVERLWKTCFHDTDEFIRFYFDRKYLDENALVSRNEKGHAVAVLQMLPYPMTFGQEVVNVSYISGACTLPEARSRGIMRELLGEAFRRMKQRGLAFSILIPQEDWLYDYYARVGYSPVFKVVERCYSVHERDLQGKFRVEVARNASEITGEWFAYFEEQNRRRKFCVQHLREDFDAVVQDLFAEDGRLIAVRGENGRLAGMAFAVPDGDRVRVNDWFYDMEGASKVLLAALQETFGVQKVICREVARVGEGTRRGMARVVDAEQVLRLYARENPEKTSVIRVEDEQVPQNSGLYLLEKGLCRRVEESPGTPEMAMTVGELTCLVMSGEVTAPFMSLMLD